MNDPKHDIVQDIKRVASELGKVPTIREYHAHGGKYSERQIFIHFGSWVICRNAAGLQGAEKKEKKSELKAEDLFGANIREVIKSVAPEIKRSLSDFKDTLILGDTHFPFVSQDALTAVYEFCDRVKPKRIIQVGDLYDMFSAGKFPRSRNIYNPHEEIALGAEMAKAMWEMLQKLSPGAECFQILGNHDVRPIKRVIEAFPEGEVFFSLDRYFQFTGVKTLMDIRQPLIFPEFTVIHGHKTKLGDHRDELHQNVICGHSHRGGVSFRVIGGRILWELNAGYLGNPESKALSYTPLKVTNWTHGLGYVDQDGPRFISL
jgi:predicted phosphodiesterase